MTDTELLNGLQRLFDKNVTALRSCRSGVKIDLAPSDIAWGDDTQSAFPDEHRQYFGGGDPPTEQNRDGAFGPDIRIAIARAIEGESAAGR